MNLILLLLIHFSIRFVCGNYSDGAVIYRNVKEIDYMSVKESLSSFNMLTPDPDANKAINKFHASLSDIFDKHAPIKTRKLKNTYFPIMTPELKSAIYARNMSRNKFYKVKTTHYHTLYKARRNKVNSIKRSITSKHFTKHCQGGTSNSHFWKAIKPFFTKNSIMGDEIMLRENENIVTDSDNICDIFNDYFVSIGSDIAPQEDTMNSNITSEIINSYKNHPSIQIIERNCTYYPFKIAETNARNIENIISDLKIDKAPGYDEITPYFIKTLKHELSVPLATLINNCIRQNVFPDCMKKANISPVYKKKDKLLKDNYRSINILPVLSKIYERVINDQFSAFVDAVFHPLLSGFRKKHGCKDVLSLLTEDWTWALDQRLYVGTIAIDLSKAFDCMPHGLLLAKLHAYGVAYESCELLKSYLYKRMQRVRIGESTSEWVTSKKRCTTGLDPWTSSLQYIY